MLLDTNVISELMRSRPDPAVMDWFAEHSGARFHISAITRAEIMLGIALLPAGKRRAAIDGAARSMFAEEFGDRCLPFDDRAADLYGPLVATRVKAGKPMTVEDAQIAAIALSHGLPLVTRNVRDFAGIDGLTVVDPWQPGS